MTDKEKRARKYMHNQRHLARKKRMAQQLKGYLSPYEWMDERYVGNGQWEKIEKPYLRTIYKSSNCERYRYYKRISNRRVRRTNQHIPNGNGYRRIFDYAWEVD